MSSNSAETASDSALTFPRSRWTVGLRKGSNAGLVFSVDPSSIFFLLRFPRPCSVQSRYIQYKPCTNTSTLSIKTLHPYKPWYDDVQGRPVRESAHGLAVRSARLDAQTGSDQARDRFVRSSSPPSFPLIPDGSHGNVEYKLKLNQASADRVQKLITQLRWRLVQGGGECLYELGVLDDGSLIGISEQDMSESLRTLRDMADSLGATCRVTRRLEIIDAQPVPLPLSPSDKAQNGRPARTETYAENGHPRIRRHRQSSDGRSPAGDDGVQAGKMGKGSKECQGIATDSVAAQTGSCQQMAGQRKIDQKVIKVTADGLDGAGGREVTEDTKSGQDLAPVTGSQTTCRRTSGGEAAASVEDSIDRAKGRTENWRARLGDACAYQRWQSGTNAVDVEKEQEKGADQRQRSFVTEVLVVGQTDESMVAYDSIWNELSNLTV